MPSLPSLEAFAKGTFATAAGVATLGCGLLYYGQNYLIYPSAFPPGSRTEVPVPTDFGLEYQDLPLVTEDGLTLRCYLLMQRTEISNSHAPHIDYPEQQTHEEFASTRPTVLMFHGNGGNHGHRIPLAKVFYVKMRCNVLMLSYRGYGRSEGSPSESGIRIDAQAALNYVTSHPYLQNTPVILYGQSIGGAVAIDLASRNPSKITALILENTFTNLPRLVPQALPLLGPLSFLCHQKWDSASKIPLIPRTMPILMLSGVLDEVVPREHMQELWQIVSRRQGAKFIGTENKSDVSSVGNGKSKFIEFEAGHHNDTCVQQGYWTAVADFVASLGRR
ncbi:Alpha/Beta hydrolase protein [Suillus paluster]|uniref:Alpha/Beta hydrolase protein n=1 Tax=Suillus paluster TaxID=48578 RepID=UPI001B884157|nr:Alpha/Beta hydrolase protein [Suillus paluster]KAG1736683.1 Alpha/Beta hydrolase protein [Suillus paluster]